MCCLKKSVDISTVPGSCNENKYVPGIYLRLVQVCFSIHLILREYMFVPLHY